MCAALALGADAVQVGTRFAATEESSAHSVFKQAIVESGDGATVLTMKKVAPVRLIRTAFALRVLDAEARGAGKEELLALLGRKREMRGMFEGDMEEGEFEAGQSVALVDDVRSAASVLQDMLQECIATIMQLPKTLEH